MAIDRRDFHNIQLADVQELIDLHVVENRTVEYKRDHYNLGIDQARQEFAKDVSGMANSAGGYLLIGIAENNGVAAGLVGMADLNVDREKQRIEQILRVGLDPALLGVQIESVSLENGNQLLILRVPKSLAAPHQVVINGANKFYVRDTAGCHEANVEELRTMFNAGADAETQFLEFVERRMGILDQGEARLGLNFPFNLGYALIHIMPLSALRGRPVIDPPVVAPLREPFRPPGGQNWGGRVNFHGYLFYREGELCHGYTQIYRSGAVEAAQAGIVTEHEGNLYVRGNVLIEDMVTAVKRYMGGLRALGINPPFFVQISLVGVGGASLLLPDARPGRLVRGQEAPRLMDPPILRLPWAEITDYLDDHGYELALQPAMDALVNAAGVARCQYFDEEGHFLLP